jgi:F-type H+-transporting ATPase subunit epsilon
MSEFKVFIFAADNAFYEGPCESLVIPTLQGQYGILPNHSNMISAIVPGMMKYKLPGQEDKIAAVSAGLVKIENNEVLVLVDSIERPEDIDENRARKAADDAKEAMLQKKSIMEYRTAQAHLARAVNRLKLKNRHNNY